MKARFLTIFITLSIFTVILLSMEVQATEYTEVDAKVILTQIEKGEDVHYTDCCIVGKLNTSNITLKTVQDPQYYESSIVGYIPEERLVFYDINKNLRVIESNIIITDSIFENDLDFSNVLFNNSVHFSNTRFNNSADFSNTRFNNSANFHWSRFNNSAYFSWARFNDSVYFSGARFNNSAYFPLARFNNSVYFSGARFNNSADFSNTRFNNSADFSGARFNNSAIFSGVNFDSSTHFGIPETSENIFTDGKTCALFMNSYNNEARYSDADNVYYNYRKSAQDKKELTSPSKWIDILSCITCGYGVRLSHTIGCIISILVVFSIFYGGASRFYVLSDATEKKENISYLEPVLLSIRGFTTLGSGDLYSKNNFFRILVTLEGLLGWIMLGIFMATLTNLLMRS